MKRKEVKEGLIVFARNSISGCIVEGGPRFGYKILSAEANWRAPGRWDSGGNVQSANGKGILVRAVRKNAGEWELEENLEFVSTLVSMVLLEEFQTKCAALKEEADKNKMVVETKRKAYRKLEKRAEVLGYDIRVHDWKVKIDIFEFEKLLLEIETLRAK